MLVVVLIVLCTDMSATILLLAFPSTIIQSSEYVCLIHMLVIQANSFHLQTGLKFIEKIPFHTFEHLTDLRRGNVLFNGQMKNVFTSECFQLILSCIAIE